MQDVIPLNMVMYLCYYNKDTKTEREFVRYITRGNTYCHFLTGKTVRRVLIEDIDTLNGFHNSLLRKFIINSDDKLVTAAYSPQRI